MPTKFTDDSIAYVELYVSDAVPALQTLTAALGFSARALAEHPDRYSVLLSRGPTRLIVTEPRGQGPVAEWLAAHGDGVRDIALCRSDLDYVADHSRQTLLPVVGPRVDAATGTLHAQVGGVGALQHTLLCARDGTNMPPGSDWQPLRTIA
ncbi:hypothetical protein [Micromonospora sp. WMMD737]|uniref:hypothetical protein n=1 Tax=Micromonospora sp. WMMD737 TaxID=3404113 RepID=UPI003B936B6E